MSRIPLLKLEGITYRRGTKPLVQGVEFDLDRGDILAIVGPNGAGKTTLLRIMAGLLSPTQGRVWFLEKCINEMSLAQRAKSVAVVGQLNEVDSRLILKEYVALGRIPYNTAVSVSDNNSKVEDAISLAGLKNQALVPFGQLSGGERQRAHLARAICQEPELLFLDEPTNHLDPKARGELLSIILNLGITVVAVLHDLQLVPLFASKVAVMTSSRLIAFGLPDMALSSENVRSVFGVDLIKVPHPSGNRDLCFMDIKLDKSGNDKNQEF